MVWRLGDPQGQESAKVRFDIVPFTRGVGLDIGCGTEKVFPHCIGVDNGHHFGKSGADLMLRDAVDLQIFNDNYMDFVFSSHLLEHIEDTHAALREWWRVVKEGGYLILYLPHKEFYPNVGTIGANPDHKHDFLPDDIINVMREIGAEFDLVVNEERDTDNGMGAHGNEYSFLQVYKKLPMSEDSFVRNEKHSWQTSNFAGRTACVVRYGGIGDCIQASSILPQLKRRGYRITMMTHDLGATVLGNNPYIDEWFVQDKGQVPDAWLYDFWEHQAKKFDLFINLSESVEATLLTIPKRTNNGWPAAVKRKYLDLNYVEWTHELAQVPFVPDPRFYPTKDEIVRAMVQREDVGGFAIMFALAGSSIHKFYPWQDHVIRRVLEEIPEAQFVLVGGQDAVDLQKGLYNTPRIHCTAAKMDVRQTLSLALQCDVVIGPETGVLNAVSHEPMAKVVFLSHSSENNLTRDWVNTASLTPDLSMAPCYPCHQLHYGKGACPTDKNTGAAMCSAGIDPELAVAAIRMAYEAWKTERGGARAAG
jgi:ADP-heptose:LPS heptosyltransferase/predicted SAM-dependent methyltransferase